MDLNITALQLFRILKEKLGENEADALVNFVDARMKENNENNLRILATKEDLAKLDTKISDVKAEIIKRVFGFFVALMLAIVGLYFKK